MFRHLGGREPHLNEPSYNSRGKNIYVHNYFTLAYLFCSLALFTQRAKKKTGISKKETMHIQKDEWRKYVICLRNKWLGKRYSLH